VHNCKLLYAVTLTAAITLSLCGAVTLLDEFETAIIDSAVQQPDCED